jgi:hypothetical protein
VEVPNYDGSLKVETLVDWIGNLKCYFEYKKIEDPQRMKFSTIMFATTKSNTHKSVKSQAPRC